MSKWKADGCPSHLCTQAHQEHGSEHWEPIFPAQLGDEKAHNQEAKEHVHLSKQAEGPTKDEREKTNGLQVFGILNKQNVANPRK